MLPASKHSLRTAFAVTVAFTFAACTTPHEKRPEVSHPPPQHSETSPPAPEPAPPTTEPEAPSPPPAAPPSRVLDPAAVPVVARLAKQLRVPEGEINVVQVARADWPNGCLGLAADGEICSQAITPGFAVSLVVHDQRYEFRTDESGRRIRLAFAPLIETGDALIRWQDSGSFSMLVVGTERVAFGLRGGPVLVAPLPVPERAPELAGFLARFAPFHARTPAGEVTVRGVGTARATTVEQRQIAEWARLVSLEAENGLTRRADDRALVWRRTGGVAGFCDEVVVSRAGYAAAWPCRYSREQPTATVALSPSELEQLYQWLDTLAPFTWTDDGANVADAITIKLDLAGQGTKPLSEPERERMFEFAHVLVRRLLTDGATGANGKPK